VGRAGLTAAAAVIAGLVARPPDWPVRGAGRLLPDILFSRSTCAPLVALTLDDGPDPARPHQLAIARRHGYRCVLGSIYPWDAHLGHGRLVAADVLRPARPGAIVVLHEGRPDRVGVVDMLDTLMVGLADRGLRTVSVSTLLATA